MAIMVMRLVSGKTCSRRLCSSSRISSLAGSHRKACPRYKDWILVAAWASAMVYDVPNEGFGGFLPAIGHHGRRRRRFGDNDERQHTPLAAGNDDLKHL